MSVLHMKFIFMNCFFACCQAFRRKLSASFWVLVSSKFEESQLLRNMMQSNQMLKLISINRAMNISHFFVFTKIYKRNFTYGYCWYKRSGRLHGCRWHGYRCRCYRHCRRLRLFLAEGGGEGGEGLGGLVLCSVRLSLRLPLHPNVLEVVHLPPLK